MSYCLYTDIIGTSGYLANIGTDDIGTTRMASLIQIADSTIDSALSKLYEVPFDSGTETPPIIKTISIKLTSCEVLKHLFTGDGVNKNENTEMMCKQAMDMLDAIASEDSEILDINGDVVGLKDTDQIDSNTKDYPTTFDMDAVEDSKVSTDRLDDIASDREE